MLTSILQFISANTAYIMLVVAIFYFVCLFFSIARHRKTGEGYTIHFKYVIGFALVIGVAIYCLVTGTNLNEFIY